MSYGHAEGSQCLPLNICTGSCGLLWFRQWKTVVLYFQTTAELPCAKLRKALPSAAQHSKQPYFSSGILLIYPTWRLITTFCATALLHAPHTHWTAIRHGCAACRHTCSSLQPSQTCGTWIAAFTRIWAILPWDTVTSPAFPSPAGSVTPTPVMAAPTRSCGCAAQRCATARWRCARGFDAGRRVRPGHSRRSPSRSWRGCSAASTE